MIDSTGNATQNQTSLSRTAKATEAARAAGKLFKPGQSGNPGGKPSGSRNALQGQFFRVLAADFERYGKSAIESMRKRDPSGYVKTVASLMPKELELKRPLEQFGDDELIAAVEVLRRTLAAKVGAKSLPNVVSEQ